ncbi:3-phosphoshikimate 1-carboxyvinyltransferase [Geoglobus acetivorans]
MNVKISKSNINGTITAPPSKSYTHRAFISSSLSPKSVIYNPLISEDTIATLISCKKMGADFVKKNRNVYFLGTETIKPGYYNTMNSGTTLRILLSLLSTIPHSSVIDGDESLRKRPNRELVSVLKKLGARIHGSHDYNAPLRVRGKINPGQLEISGKSSQFVTSLLFALPLLEGESTLKVGEIKSRPYIDITLDVLEQSNISIETEGSTFYIYPSEFRLREFTIPPDYSSMSYLISAGLLAGKVVIENAIDSKQGDKRFIEVAREMGGTVKKRGNKIIAENSELEAIEFDAGDTPDIVPTVAVLGAVARGTTVIYNAEHLRIKETDRIKTVVENLKRLGVEARETKDGMIIRGGGVSKGTVDSHGDHRIAMGFSLLGLVGEVTVKNAECVSISYPNYFEDLKKLGAGVEVL